MTDQAKTTVINSEEMEFEIVAPEDVAATPKQESKMDAEPCPAYVPRNEGKLTKDFCLSSNILSISFTDEQKNQILRTNCPGMKQKPGDDFEMVEAQSPFVDAAILLSQRIRTENGAPTFSTSGDARIDFFFHVMEQTTPIDTIRLLEASWDLNALHTLKLVASLRDIQHGKGIRGQYQHCLYWLYQNHAKTLYENLPILLGLGYWKDALQMLVIACFDGFVHPYFAHDDGANAKSAEKIPEWKQIGLKKQKRRNGVHHQKDIDNRIYNAKISKFYKATGVGRAGEATKGEMQKLRLQFARDMYNSSKRYQLFHVRVAQIFAEQLVKDLTEYQKEDGSGSRNVSLAAKWAPSLEGHFDRYTLISSSIAVELAKLLEKVDILHKPIPIAVYLSRRMYNKEVCGPLRKFCEIPEIRISNKEWDQVNYKRVPAKCMKKNKLHFIKHDKVRLETYLKKDDSKVAGATLKPIEIINSVMSMTEATEEVEKTILEKQWISLADDIKVKGGALLKGAIAICDVSGSMEGDPMSAAIGLTLLTMNMTSAPWNSVCITFHEQPKIFHLRSELSLIQKVEALKCMEWGGTTNFQAVFTEILTLGKQNKLTPDQMPKTLFVFTDMEFDEAFNPLQFDDDFHPLPHLIKPSTRTNFEWAQKQFAAAGYELPTMVFWNLRSAHAKNSTPVRVDENGTILLSGWSGQLLAFIMSQEDLATCSPWKFVESLINKEKYDKLVVYD